MQENMSASDSDMTPITVVTGFLGVSSSMTPCMNDVWGIFRSHSVSPSFSFFPLLLSTTGRKDYACELHSQGAEYMEDRCPGERIWRGQLLMMVRRLVRWLGGDRNGIGTTRPDRRTTTPCTYCGLPQRFSHKSIIHQTVI